MERNPRSLSQSRIPGETGVEFCKLARSRRPIIVSSSAEGQVAISVGCYTLDLTTEEAVAIADEVLAVANQKGATRG